MLLEFAARVRAFVPVGPPDPDSLLMLGLSQHPVRRLEQETGVQKGGG